MDLDVSTPKPAHFLIFLPRYVSCNIWRINFFFQYWGMNLGPLHWDTPPALLKFFILKLSHYIAELPRLGLNSRSFSFGLLVCWGYRCVPPYLGFCWFCSQVFLCFPLSSLLMVEVFHIAYYDIMFESRGLKICLRALNMCTGKKGLANWQPHYSKGLSVECLGSFPEETCLNSCLTKTWLQWAESETRRDLGEFRHLVCV